MHSQSPTSEYAFTDMHGKHETDITVDKNGHVNTKRLYTLTITLSD